MLAYCLTLLVMQLAYFWLVGLDHKFLISGYQLSFNGSPQNLHISLVWSRSSKPTIKHFFLLLLLLQQPFYSPLDCVWDY